MGKKVRVRFKVKNIESFVIGIFFSVCFLVCSLLYAKAESQKGDVSNKSGFELLDRVVATVNGEAIFYSKIQTKLKTSNIVVFSSYPASDSSDDFSKALNDEINIKLAIQATKSLGIASDIDVDKKIAEFLTSHHLSKQELLKELESQGISFEKYKKDFEDQLILKDFQTRVIYPLVKVTDKDLESYYLRKTSKNDRSNLKYDIRMIYIKQDELASQRVKVVVDELKSNKSFEEVVKLYSDDSSTRKEGGLIQGVSLRDLSSDISKVLKDLKPMSYSSPIKTKEGYYIVYLVSTSLGEDKNFNSSKQKLQMEYSQELYERNLIGWLETQRRKSQISINK